MGGFFFGYLTAVLFWFGKHASTTTVEATCDLLLGLDDQSLSVEMIAWYQ